MSCRNINTMLGNYLPLTGGIMRGDLRVDSNLVMGYTRAGGWAWSMNYSKAGVKTPFMHIYGANDTLHLINIGGEVYYQCVLNIDLDNKRVGINVENPQYPLHVKGDIYCTGKIITDGGVVNNSVQSQSLDGQQNMGGVFRELDLRKLAPARGRRAA